VETDGLWKELKDRGARVERMGRDYGRYHSILTDLASKPSITLQIQDEMQKGKTVEETLAGLHIDAELHKLQDEHKTKTQQTQEDFKRLLEQQESEARQRREKLKKEKAEWEMREIMWLHKEKHNQEERLRQVETAHALDRRVQQAKLDRLARETAIREAEQKKKREEEEQKRHQQVIEDAKLKFRASMLQNKQIQNQLDFLRVGAQAGLTRVGVADILLYGKGFTNIDSEGDESKMPRTILNIWCDVCRQPNATQAWMCK
jgi:hypothetical protein